MDILVPDKLSDILIAGGCAIALVIGALAILVNVLNSTKD